VAGSIVQSAYAVDDSGGSSSTVAVTINGVTAGNLLAVIVAWGNPTGTITCTTSDGTSYTADAAGRVTAVAGGQASQVFYLPNSGSGSHTITATLSSSTPFRRIRVVEVANVLTSSPEDKAAAQGQDSVGTTTDSISSSATSATTNATDFILGFEQDGDNVDPGTGTLAAGTGYTLNGTNQILGVESKNVSVTGAQTATFTDTKNANRTVHVLALKALPGTPTYDVDRPWLKDIVNQPGIGAYEALNPLAWV
jgi:hypothetical protein